MSDAIAHFRYANTIADATFMFGNTTRNNTPTNNIWTCGPTNSWTKMLTHRSWYYKNDARQRRKQHRHVGWQINSEHRETSPDCVRMCNYMGACIQTRVHMTTYPGMPVLRVSTTTCVWAIVGNNQVDHMKLPTTSVAWMTIHCYPHRNTTDHRCMCQFTVNPICWHTTKNIKHRNDKILRRDPGRPHGAPNHKRTIAIECKNVCETKRQWNNANGFATPKNQ